MNRAKTVGMSEEHYSSAALLDKSDNIDLIFDYVVSKKYASGMNSNEKANLRGISKQYVARTGQLYYRHRVGRSGSAYKELLVIRDNTELKSIIKYTHGL